jgi:hypothetical protein
MADPIKNPELDVEKAEQVASPDESNASKTKRYLIGGLILVGVIGAAVLFAVLKH